VGGTWACSVDAGRIGRELAAFAEAQIVVQLFYETPILLVLALFLCKSRQLTKKWMQPLLNGYFI
jgi:hypothetical protein